jgi:hypothetical protein
MFQKKMENCRQNQRRDPSCGGTSVSLERLPGIGQPAFQQWISRLPLTGGSDMTDRTRDEIARILKDNTRSKADRVDELLRMREDARALQRAATESPMGNETPDSSGLRDIDRALERLGHSDLTEAEENSAATL